MGVIKELDKAIEQTKAIAAAAEAEDVNLLEQFFGRHPGAQCWGCEHIEELKLKAGYGNCLYLAESLREKSIPVEHVVVELNANAEHCRTFKGTPEWWQHMEEAHQSPEDQNGVKAGVDFPGTLRR